MSNSRIIAGAVLGMMVCCSLAFTQLPKPGDDAWRFLDSDINSLARQGEAAAIKGDLQKAESFYLAYLQRNSKNSRILYNLACCYGRQGKALPAAEVLMRAVNAGFTDISFIEKDQDFEKVRSSAAFQEALKQARLAVSDMGKSLFVEAPRMMTCRYRLPADFRPDQACPLVIGLHGNGGNAEIFLRSLPAEIFRDMICAAPEGAYARWDLAYLPGKSCSWFLEGVDKSLWSKVDPPTEKYLLNVIAAFNSQFKISGVYLLGFSQGVAAAYMTGIHNPSQIKGILAFSGDFPEELVSTQDLQKGKDIPVFISHGKSDTAIKESFSLKALELLQQHGYDVQFCSFDAGHVIPPDVLKKAASWIREKKAKP